MKRLYDLKIDFNSDIFNLDNLLQGILSALENIKLKLQNINGEQLSHLHPLRKKQAILCTARDIMHILVDGDMRRHWSV